MQERREFARKDTGGHLEIVSVQGSGSIPDERATVLNCSRSGMLFKVKSPRKRLLRTQEPILQRKDTVTALLRLPPEFSDIQVLGEVVRVERATDDPEFLNIGLRFFWDAQRQSGLDDHFQALGRILSPEDARLRRDEPKRATARSSRLEKASSARIAKGSSARLERPGSRSERNKATIALPPPGEDSSAVLAKMGARTLEESAARGSSENDLTAWARARIDTAPKPAAPPPVYTSLVGPELGLYARGSARLEGGAAAIELPDHFARQAAPDSITVQVTPTEECRGLFVQRVGTRLVVREQGGGKSAAGFDWLVLAQRRP